MECSSAAIEGLKAFMKLHPSYRKKEIQACMAKAADFIETIQQPDGSWFGFLFTSPMIWLHNPNPNPNPFDIALTDLGMAHGGFAIHMGHGLASKG